MQARSLTGRATGAAAPRTATRRRTLVVLAAGRTAVVTGGSRGIGERAASLRAKPVLPPPPRRRRHGPVLSPCNRRPESPLTSPSVQALRW